MTTDSTAANPLLERLKTNATATPDQLALTFLNPGPNGGVIEKEMKYKDVMKQTEALAANLLAKGLKKGDLAVLVYPPSLEFIIAFLSCLMVGVVAVPVFPPHPARKDTLLMFSKIVESCGAKYALTSASYSHMKKLSSLKESFAKFLTGSKSTWPEQLTWITTDTLDSPSKKRLSQLTSCAPSPPSSLAFLQYTSGSTSEPKGVQITHGNLADNLTKITTELEAGKDTVVASWLPQYHDMGLIGSYLGTLYCGGKGYYMSPLSFVQRPMLWIEAASRFGATHMQAPNFAFKLTARKFNPKKYKVRGEEGKGGVLDLSNVRHVINAAEPVTAESIDRFLTAFRPFGFPKEVIFPTYGLAEHTVFVCSGGKQRLDVSKRSLEVDGKVVSVEKGGIDEDGVVSKLVGCGFPEKQRVDVRIVDAERFVEMDEDRVGEIWVRSPSKAAGYYGKEKESRLEFCAKIVEERVHSNDDIGEGDLESAAVTEDETVDNLSDGYLRTGDLGFLHNKELFVCGRIKDLIIIGGRNYYPQDVEATAEAAASKLVRPGCSAAFTVEMNSGDDEEVAMVCEMKEVPITKDIESVCSELVTMLRSAVTKEHSLTLSHIWLLQPRTVMKTTSGKIARAWCRRAFLNNTFSSVYTKSFPKPTTLPTTEEAIDSPKKESPLEIEDGEGKEVIMGSKDDLVTIPPPDCITADIDGETDGQVIRNLDKKVILERLSLDLSRMMSIDKPPADSPLNTFMDSLSISQFKGLLERKYITKISDEYLFQELCTLRKLAEVVKLGYAPDDVDQNLSKGVKRRKGLAGAMGCPPGVYCVVM